MRSVVLFRVNRGITGGSDITWLTFSKDNFVGLGGGVLLVGRK